MSDSGNDFSQNKNLNCRDPIPDVRWINNYYNTNKIFNSDYSLT